MNRHPEYAIRLDDLDSVNDDLVEPLGFDRTMCDRRQSEKPRGNHSVEHDPSRTVFCRHMLSSFHLTTN